MYSRPRRNAGFAWARTNIRRCRDWCTAIRTACYFLVTDRCAAYCRYCTRSRLVSNAQDYNFHPEYEQGLRYIESHPEVRDVLLSGGDPLLLSDKKLEHLLSRLRAIKHVEFIRIGSRIPVFLPQRITPELCEILQESTVRFG
jgi:lysine 2,3-aminomutase